jgi:hypothetical protein
MCHKRFKEITGLEVELENEEDPTATKTFYFHLTEYYIFWVEMVDANSRRFLMFDISSINDKKLNLEWKKLFVALSQKYNPSIYLQDLFDDEEEYNQDVQDYVFDDDEEDFQDSWG